MRADSYFVYFVYYVHAVHKFNITRAVGPHCNDMPARASGASLVAPGMSQPTGALARIMPLWLCQGCRNLLAFTLLELAVTANSTRADKAHSVWLDIY